MKVPNYTAPDRFRPGFTIVELLIVIVVIAILAAITIVSYNGINTRARQSSLLSDAHGAATLMGSDQVVGGAYPTSLSAVNGGKGIPASDGTSYSFHSDGTSYCITVNSRYSGVNSYYITNTNPTPTLGQCSQDLGAAVTTVAGNGTLGYAEGNTATSLVASPAGLVADGSGNLYFTDSSTSRIRKLTTGGVTSFIAGLPGGSYQEGIGTAAHFSGPQALSITPGNDLVIADTNFHKVRSLDLSNNQSYFYAGSTQGNAGAINTVATSIKFNVPRGIVYLPGTNSTVVADSQNNRLVQLDTSGTITYIVGQTSGGFAEGQGPAAKFNFPEGLAADSTGNVYVADTYNNRIRKVDTSGNVTTIAGSGTAGFANGNGTSAQFKNPSALTVASDGTIYVSDSGNNQIRKIAPDKTVTTIAGSDTGAAGFADGNGSAALFSNPIGIAIASDGRLYVCDLGNNRIRAISI